MPKSRHNDRRCIGTGDALSPEAVAIRFVQGPGGDIVPDLTEKLPGRGAWVTADREIFLSVLKRKLFQKAFRGEARRPDHVSDDVHFADAIDEALLSRALERLGLARKAGQLVTGADTVRRSAATLLGYVYPSDAADDGVRKVKGRLEAAGLSDHIKLSADAERLGRALGDLGVIHIGVVRGPVGARAMWEVRRWRAFVGDKRSD